MTTTIAGQPVLVDVDGDAQAWMDRFMPESTIFRCAQAAIDSYLSGPRGSGDFFTSSLPELPPVEIGQIQWPCVGASRFARGLFLVDQVGLFNILREAWGIEVPTTFPPYAIPETWAQTKNQTVAVVLAADVVVHLFVLLPVRVSEDVWVLSMVDGRYYGLSQPEKVNAINPEKPSATWAEYFAALTEFKYNVRYTAESGISYGRPDPILRDPQVALCYAIDAGCFSVGCRPVIPFPTVPNQTQAAFIQVVKCELPTAAQAKKTVLFSLDKVTGGASGAATKPSSVQFATRSVDSYYSGENRSYTYEQFMGSGKGVVLFTKSLWNVHRPGTVGNTEFQDYTSTIASKLNFWNAEEYFITLPDLVLIEPSGFDDYIVFDTLKKTTIVRSLLVDFIAPYHVSQAPTGEESASLPTLWFHTANQTVLAKLPDGAPAGGVTSGVLNKVTAQAQIMDFALTVPAGFGGAPTFYQALVTCVNGEKTEFPPGKIVHLVWMDCVLWQTGDPYGSPIAYEGWVISTGGGGGGSLSGVATSWGTQSGGDFAGLKYADVTVIEATDQNLLGTSVRVYDRKGCILDINVTDYTVWAHELWASSMDTSKPCPAAVQYWSADDRCCDPDTAIYRECEA